MEDSLCRLWPSLVWGKNETYSYSNFAEFYTYFAGDWSLPYQLGYDYACATNSTSSEFSSTFEPISVFESSLLNADLNLLYLGFTGTYVDVVEDPWLSAHQQYHINTSIPFLQTTFARDKPISILACTEQFQFCSDPTTCTPLLGYGQAQQYLASHISLTQNQNITLSRIVQGLSDASLVEIAQIFTAISVPLLAGSKTVTAAKHTISLPLPPNQWKAELAYWQAISLAQATAQHHHVRDGSDRRKAGMSCSARDG